MRKNSQVQKRTSQTEIIQRYEAAKQKNRQLYLDGDQLADRLPIGMHRTQIQDAQEVINLRTSTAPRQHWLTDRTSLSLSGYQKLSKAKEVADSITENYDSESKKC